VVFLSTVVAGATFFNCSLLALIYDKMLAMFEKWCLFDIVFCFSVFLYLVPFFCLFFQKYASFF